MTNRRHVITVLTLLLFTIKVSGKSPKDSFLTKLYFPFDIGFQNYPNYNLKSGLILKTGIEYRLKNDAGLYFRFNYNYRLNSYNNSDIPGTNVSKDNISFNDYLIGSGYRFGINKRFKQFILLQGGISTCEYHQVATESENSYNITSKDKSILFVQTTIGTEYYIAKTTAITIELFYISNLKNTPLTSSKINNGTLGISIGLTTTLF